MIQKEVLLPGGEGGRPDLTQGDPEEGLDPTRDLDPITGLLRPGVIDPHPGLAIFRKDLILLKKTSLTMRMILMAPTTMVLIMVHVPRD